MFENKYSQNKLETSNKKIDKPEKQIVNDKKENFLPCDHYEYEYKQCSSFKAKMYRYFRGEVYSENIHECNFYQQLFMDCMKYDRETSKNANLLKDLKKYEVEMIIKRLDSMKQNNIWELRNTPPSDWNSPLPDWCEKQIKDTYWYKSINKKE